MPCEHNNPVKQIQKINSKGVGFNSKEPGIACPLIQVNEAERIKNICKRNDILDSLVKNETSVETYYFILW